MALRLPLRLLRGLRLTPARTARTALFSSDSSSSGPPETPTPLFIPRHRDPRDRQSPPPTGSLLSLIGGPGPILSRRAPSAASTTPSTEDVFSLEFPHYSGSGVAFGVPGSVAADENMFRICVFATKHNTHLTFTKPSKDVLLTLSCGNVGFKKANRGTFEAAYQLASVFMQRLEEKGLRPRDVEVVFRDFGPGRDAFTKVLLGKEGKAIRAVVRRVTDASRLKFGGTRSRAARRL